MIFIMRSWRKQNTLPDGWLLLPLVATLPNVAGEPLSHTYRFILDPSIIDTLYLVELFANALPASFSGSDYLGCFNADPDRRPLMFEMCMPIPNPDKKRTLYVSDNVFLSYIALLLHPTPAQRPHRLSWWYRGSMWHARALRTEHPPRQGNPPYNQLRTASPLPCIGHRSRVLAAEEEKDRGGLPITTHHGRAAAQHKYQR